MRIISGNKYINGKFAGYFSITGNIFLFIVKMWAGIVTGSIALIADAWHTLSDSFSSIIMLGSIYISNKPADHEHPFGHGRAEIIASLVLGLFLVLISINFFYESIVSILEKDTVNFGLFAIIATSFSLVVKEIMARVSFTAAEKENYQSLKADGWHHRSDALTSAVILVGIFAGKYVWWVDGALGILVSLVLLILAYRIVKGSINPLLGEKPDDEIIDKIHEISKEIYKYDLQLHHFKIHRYGNHTELTFHIKLPGDYQIEYANQITSEFILKIKAELNIFATIYIDAYNKNTID